MIDVSSEFHLSGQTPVFFPKFVAGCPGFLRFSGKKDPWKEVSPYIPIMFSQLSFQKPAASPGFWKEGSLERLEMQGAPRSSLLKPTTGFAVPGGRPGQLFGRAHPALRAVPGRQGLSSMRGSHGLRVSSSFGAGAIGSLVPAFLVVFEDLRTLLVPDKGKCNWWIPFGNQKKPKEPQPLEETDAYMRR